MNPEKNFFAPKATVIKNLLQLMKSRKMLCIPSSEHLSAGRKDRYRLNEMLLDDLSISCGIKSQYL